MKKISESDKRKIKDHIMKDLIKLNRDTIDLYTINNDSLKISNVKNELILLPFSENDIIECITELRINGYINTNATVPSENNDAIIQLTLVTLFGKQIMYNGGFVEDYENKKSEKQYKKIMIWIGIATLLITLFTLLITLFIKNNTAVTNPIIIILFKILTCRNSFNW